MTTDVLGKINNVFTSFIIWKTVVVQLFSHYNTLGRCCLTLSSCLFASSLRQRKVEGESLNKNCTGTQNLCILLHSAVGSVLGVFNWGFFFTTYQIPFHQTINHTGTLIHPWAFFLTATESAEFLYNILIRAIGLNASDSCVLLKVIRLEFK